MPSGLNAAAIVSKPASKQPHLILALNRHDAADFPPVLLALALDQYLSVVLEPLLQKNDKSMTVNRGCQSSASSFIAGLVNSRAILGTAGAAPFAHTSLS
jgi:hypothetical protein